MGGFGYRLTRKIFVEHLLVKGCMQLCIEEYESWNAAGRERRRMNEGDVIWRSKARSTALLVTSHQAVKECEPKTWSLIFRFGHGVSERDALQAPGVTSLVLK